MKEYASLEENLFQEIKGRIKEDDSTVPYFENGYYPCEEKAYMHARKSLVSQCFIKKGTIITQKMLTAKRPGTGV